MLTYELPVGHTIRANTEVVFHMYRGGCGKLYNIFAKITKNHLKKYLKFRIIKLILKSVEINIKTTNKKNRHERSDDEGTKRIQLRSNSSG